MADNYWGNSARALLGQGLAMGWGDELEAKIRTMSGDETYEQELAMIADSYDAYEDENSGTALGLEIAGSFLPTVAAYAAAPFTGGATAPLAVANTARLANLANKARTVFNNPLGRSIISGTTSGAVSGAGTADQGERLRGGIEGAGFGFGFGAGLPILTRGGGALATRIGDKFRNRNAKRIEEGALRKVNAAIKGDGGTPDDLLKTVKEDIRIGVPARPGNYNRETISLLDTLASTPAAGPSIERGLIAVQENAGDRIVRQTNKLMGGKNFVTAVEQIKARLKAKAGVLYDEAYKFGSVDDPRLLKLLEHPDMAEAFERAQKIASRKKAAAVALGQDGSKFDLVPYELATEGGKSVSRVLPDVRTIDYMSRSLKDMIDSGYKGGGAGAADADSLKSMQKAMIEVLDEATKVDGVSAYKTARKTFASDKQIENALEEGIKDFKSIKPEELASKFKSMNEGQREAYTIGVNRYLIDIINKPSNNANYAQRIIGSNDTRSKLQTMFPSLKDDEGGMALYTAALLREAQMFKEIGGTLMNSKTAKRLSGKESLNSGDGVLDAVSLGISGLDTSLTTLIGNVLLKSSVNDKMKKRIADMLMEDDPEKVAAAVQLLNNFAAQSAAKGKKLTGIETGLSSAGAQLKDSEPETTSRPEGQRDKLRTSARAKVKAAEKPKPVYDPNSSTLKSMKELYPNNPEVWDIE